ncbi:putative N-hydroxythioamide S-beta-glucosyltransferase [Helianthus annuus]|uniref:Glycosyltransferase n=1 Tax=Helianthus annuus TaxID=4232 RepID=A0A251S8F3_HELAN|nr:UDP-glycosyltransferase 74B1 [Helianthus annuus]KAF5764288.1 putative N-hydroxythioamide S-beta-glucosyltransferase [Helianthus annuus]KAJ0450988.1 putative N-hydroxythioamide S-beta-glucosyltransferase [Helianthus annuus]KAJ0472847.1 putative N-hydroxythioamide S-beta-glucosyltransferase [Helianthus annuus]KAJ0648455.1 putative N-hydroxythioamide S-beta-glucosyltransferase [Helianthus annuus]KAJ0652283.1 putative N-hydroxythioamide S-beta-glucosyltransferase [Helianthus annuus]
MKKTYDGHVVVLPYPSQGHINPLLQFAKRLASKGLKATIATTHYTLSSITSPLVTVEPISDGFNVGGFAQVRSEELFLESFKTNGSRTLTQLIKKHQTTKNPITFVVYDSFLPWALDVAKENGILGGPFFTNSAAVTAVFSLIHGGTYRLPLRLEDCPVVILGVPPLNLEDLPSFLNVPESHPAYLKMKLNQFSNLDKADWIFSNSFQSLESEVVEGIREQWPAKLIGPMVPSAYLDGSIEGDKGYGASLWKPLDDGCTKWLETKPPNSVVYVSFGSMVSLTEQEMEEIAWGLQESGFCFLWVVKDSERHKLPKGFLDLTTQNQEKGMIVSWCNQLEMLDRDSVGCFLTHCGWNSTLEGLSLGVPMVGVPKWADQLTDAKFIMDVWRVGVRVKVDSVTGMVKRKEVVLCLNEVMDGGERSMEIKKNVGKWKELAKEAISEGGSSDKAIDEFVMSLKDTCNTQDMCLC